ncbi:MAG: hypothetical protein OQK75_05395 [Gammaproteobacteria bacterium]|nr:hypothetical protein [Gammaproteobacteria bacterium]MCW8987090.1 hypothetical protein [Gammaproteobacteria bacterium]
MPVHVDIPIKIRIGINSILNQQSNIDVMISRNLTKAFAKSQEEVVNKRGGYTNVIINDPAFNYTGSGLVKLSHTHKIELQQRIKDLIKKISSLHNSNDLSGIVQPLTSRAEERIDESRLREVFGVYGIPSYNGNGETEHVDVSESNPPQVVYRYYTFGISHQNVLQNFRAARELLASKYQAATEQFGNTSANVSGLLWKIGQNSYSFYIVNNSTGAWRTDSFVTQTYHAERRGTQVQWGESRDDLPARISYATYHNISEAENLFRQFHAGLIRNEIQDLFPRQETMAREIYRTLLDQAVDLEIQRRTAMVTQQNPGGLIVINFSNTSYICMTTLSVQHSWPGQATLYPVMEPVEIPAGSQQGNDGGDGSGRRQGRRERGGIAPWGSGEGQGQGAIYPALPASLFGLRLSCQPYMGEPSVDEMGQVGEYIKGLIQEIATRLQMSPCDRAGNFLLNAAQVIGSRASDIGNYAAINESNEAGFFSQSPHASGNMGEVNFVPSASPAIQFIRFLAGTVPLITRLSHILDRTYTLPEHSARFSGHAQNNPYFWMLRFHYDLRQDMELGVGTMFIMTCRVLMLQFLLTSKKAIDARIDNFTSYAPLFEELMIGEMADIHELRTLHGRLTRQIAEERGQRGVASDVGEWVMLNWTATTSGISDLFQGYNPDEPDIVDQGFIKRNNVTIGITDNTGHRWTEQQLQTTLAIRQNVAESVDPLIKQIRDIPELLNRFRQNKNAIRSELWSLLHEMRSSNDEVRRKVINDWTYGFEASKIQEHLQTATIPGTRFPLQGIHLQAHLAIGEFFRGDTYYAMGINSLFNRKLGLESLKEFFLFTGLILLAVICAPLAVAVGAAVATYEYSKAQERLQVFRSMIHPEVVMSQAELEAELFAAELGLALSFIPYAGRVLGTSARVGKVVIRQGIRGSARVAARYGRMSTRSIGRSLTREGAHQVGRSIRTRFTRQLAEQLKHGFVYAVARELVEDQLFDVLLQKLLFGPALQRIYSDFQDYAPGVTSGSGTIMQEPQALEHMHIMQSEPE